MVFLPDKMKVRSARTVRDSDEETEDEHVQVRSKVREEQAGHGHTSMKQEPKDRKRGSDVGLETESDKEKPGPSTSKRRRTTATVKTERTLRRQSTMTQLIEGRRPLSDTEEPDFKPFKRTPRLSWGGKGRGKGKDKQQRTLTQMIPGMRPLEIMSDEDMEQVLSDSESQDSDSQAYDMAVAQRLAVQGDVLAADLGVNVEPEAEPVQQHTNGLEEDEAEFPTVVVESIEDATSDAEEESYRPTQYIDAPSSRPGRVARLSTNTEHAGEIAAVMISPKAQGIRKPRFSLLNTPEKRRIREIPSSQSPAESPLSTQVSPQKLCRSPLQEASGNLLVSQDTPSKRKRVTFKDPSVSALKKFESTIQDSEDSDDGIEEDVPSSHTMDRCTEQSPELGEAHTCANATQSYIRERAPGNIQHSMNDHNDDTPTTPNLQTHDQELDESTVGSIETPLPSPVECLHSTPPSNGSNEQEMIPSTPMVIQDDSSDADQDEDPTPLRQSTQDVLQPNPAAVQETVDLDGEPVQVPRSPPVQQESQQSHSSKAEHQLQSEWFSYSQYVNTQPPKSSSMFVVHDPLSYSITQSLQQKNAPRKPSAAHPPSQATTVDEVTQRTPKRNRTQEMLSANTTPRRIASSQPIISPSKPPPLFIPSSFPSPAKAGMQEWSSPVHGRTQDLLRSSQYGMSLEDFSIPLPPPVEDD